ncbi:cytochrome b/b6 domain-containing protein [Microcella daejeonensis]|uniref:cytochrome b/b6 domain-containing protein n=1 Tax=Microcella daejeonensis TaxID=2994971 RepID=UPI00226F3503|nr:cytochrome b/b6 domain-containing protein [Microcella daejeonensis]WAB84741.1 cytochrome b/b6 domain-containing protein [Microcella daejeonensis]
MSGSSTRPARPAARPTAARASGGAPARPAAGGRLPRRLLITIGLALVGLVLVVLLARWFRETPPGLGFLAAYPGEYALPQDAPVGIPAWLAWQHGLNAFFLLLIIRTGLLVRTTKRPAAYWTRSNSGPIRTKNPPKKISLELWLHLAVDVLFVLNGVVYLVLLFTTGQWVRIVPTSWEVVPNAASAALQYASLSWPSEDGWVNYNSLQQLAYFSVVFLAAPLAIVTGLRMSGAWPRDAERLNRAYPIEWARALHYPVMLYFAAFIVVHVALVLATGAQRNLNHVYAARDDGSWLGLIIFAVTLVLMIGAWFAVRPIVIRPLAALTGKVTRS